MNNYEYSGEEVPPKEWDDYMEAIDVRNAWIEWFSELSFVRPVPTFVLQRIEETKHSLDDLRFKDANHE